MIQLNQISELEVQSKDEKTESDEVQSDESGCCFDVNKAVNSLEDITCIDFKEMNMDGIMKYHFLNVAVAFIFYNWYASFYGFAARKHVVLRSKVNGELTQLTFVCYRQSIAKETKFPSISRRRVPRSCTRCGCPAKCCVHIDKIIGRWFFKLFNNTHNYDMLGDQFMGMLPGYRKMTKYDIWRMNHMKHVGIKTNHIFGLFASEAGVLKMLVFEGKICTICKECCA
ncbi:putative protein FAR1-RELATED SEQUENCE 10 [Trifolium pratense]|uniref:putative protein FAR1-RELATED SEQUENCE 10 n=1 Tax=Trifolium pratense TaxID=57577 RepID=UPI001E6970F7|nr:putative protein FAR1-RELATED SEQUENCE 10 [Trifolium pratense]